MIIEGLLRYPADYVYCLFVQDKSSRKTSQIFRNSWFFIFGAMNVQDNSRFVFSLLSQFAMDHTLFWCYNEQGSNERHWWNHQELCFWDVKSKKVGMRDAENFASYENTILKVITSLHMPLEEVLAKPESIIMPPKFQVL